MGWVRQNREIEMSGQAKESLPKITGSRDTAEVLMRNVWLLGTPVLTSINQTIGGIIRWVEVRAMTGV